jgi:hypothetical protein
MSRTKWIVALLSFVAAALLLLLPRGGTPPGSPEIIARSITLHGYSENGDPQWEIHAAEGAIADEEGTLRNVVLRFVDEGSEPLAVTGAELARTKEESLMPGAVRIEREGDFVLDTSDLVWNEGENVLRAGPARLERDDVQLSAQRFAYDLDAHRARFEGGVDVSFDAGSLEADSAALDDEGLRVSGNVILHVDLGALEAVDGS